MLLLSVVGAVRIHPYLLTGVLCVQMSVNLEFQMNTKRAQGNLDAYCHLWLQLEDKTECACLNTCHVNCGIWPYNQNITYYMSILYM